MYDIPFMGQGQIVCPTDASCKKRERLFMTQRICCGLCCGQQLGWLWAQKNSIVPTIRDAAGAREARRTCGRWNFFVWGETVTA